MSQFTQLPASSFSKVTQIMSFHSAGWLEISFTWNHEVFTVTYRAYEIPACPHLSVPSLHHTHTDMRTSGLRVFVCASLFAYVEFNSCNVSVLSFDFYSTGNGHLAPKSQASSGMGLGKDMCSGRGVLSHHHYPHETRWRSSKMGEDGKGKL